MPSARSSHPAMVVSDPQSQHSMTNRFSDEIDAANANAGIHSAALSRSVTELDSSSMVTDEATARLTAGGRRTDANENIAASPSNNNNNNNSADRFTTQKISSTTADTVVVKRKRRKWEQHIGENRFFCNGRIIMSRQCSILFLTVFLITLTMTLFCVFDLPYLTARVSTLLPFVTGLLFMLAMSSLFKTSFSDPGILPRAPLCEAIEWERQATQGQRQHETDSTTEWTPPRTKVVQVAGQNVKLKYCFTCCLFRPPRSSHCSICDNCILNFDHHCPWVGNCVGLRNYRHFYFFIGILSVLDCFIGACVTTHLIMLSADQGTFLAAMKTSPTSLFTAAIALLSVWSIVGLSGFHTYLIAINQTTNEDIKGTFNSKNRPSIRNPYSSSNLIRNIIKTLFGPEPPSLLDRRGLVDDDKTITVPEEMLKQYAAEYAAFNASPPSAQNCGQRESSRRDVADTAAGCGTSSDQLRRIDVSSTTVTDASLVTVDF